MRSQLLARGGAAGVGLAAVLGMASVSSATVLTFDFGGLNNETVNQSYGDRVTVFNGNPFRYGSDGGPTPHITVEYKDLLRLGGATFGGTTPADPTRIFGDLTNVLYRDRQFAGPYANIMEIQFNADPGWMVCLHYFDLAAVYNSILGTGEDLPAKSIQIFDELGNNLTPPLVYPANDTLIPGTMPLRHRRFDYSAQPLQAQSIRIRIDLSQLFTIGGSKVDRVGIDNIKITEKAVPAPAAGGLVGAAGLLAARRRRR
jgi:hypothetical protein